jgi:hypothetical protein
MTDRSPRHRVWIRPCAFLFAFAQLRIVLILVVLAAAPAVVRAGQPAYREPDRSSILSLQWENDIFSGLGTDRHYTNGLRVSWLRGDDRLPGWVRSVARALPWYPDRGHVRGSWALGQNLYTPEDIDAAGLVADDRPYAAWLYLGRGLVAENGRVLDVMELSVGVVGPSALGEEFQKSVHAIIGSPEPRGWSNQLGDELALQAIWQRTWRHLHDGEDRGLGVDAMPHLGGALGNVFIHGSAGGTVRLGFDLPGDYGTPRIQPGLPGSEFFLPGRAFTGYLFLGGEARAVLRNMFLDGNTFRDSPSVSRRWLVADLQMGVVLQGRGVRLAYTYVVRSEEFLGQEGPDAFGAFTLSVRLRG